MSAVLCTLELQVMSSVIFIISATALRRLMPSDSIYNKNPVSAINVLFVLVSLSVSLYQIVISSLMLWNVLRHEHGNLFYCSMWYVSHLSILLIYGFLLSARATVTFISKLYMSAAFTIVGGITYIAIYVYFAVVVNSYLRSVEVD